MKPEYSVKVGVVGSDELWRVHVYGWLHRPEVDDGMWRVHVYGWLHRPEVDAWRQCELSALLGGHGVPTCRVLCALKQDVAKRGVTPGPTARMLLDVCERYPTGEVDIERHW